jgi:Tol biopolymer transport system component
VDPSHGQRSYVQDVSGGLPQPILPEGMVALLVSPDGQRMVVYAPDGTDWRYYLSPIDGSPSTPIAGMEKDEVPIQWSSDGRSIYVRGPGDFASKIYRIDLANGRRELLREIVPDQVGLIGLEANPGGIQITPDGKSYVYTYWIALRDLFLAEGMK